MPVDAVRAAVGISVQAGIWEGGDTLIRVSKLGQILNPGPIAPLSVALRRLMHMKESFCSFSHTFRQRRADLFRIGPFPALRHLLVCRVNRNRKPIAGLRTLSTSILVPTSSSVVM